MTLTRQINGESQYEEMESIKRVFHFFGVIINGNDF